jgi:hypothetical protein
MRILCLCCLAILIAVNTATAQQTIWKWTDDKGKVHYSDHPEGPDAVEVNVLESTQTYSAAEAQTQIPTNSAAQKRTQTAGSYQSFSILQPAAEETFQNPESPISVQLKIEPGLFPGDRVQLFLDGTAVNGEGSGSTSFSLPNVERGAHSVQARIVGRNGITRITSNTVTFHVRQTSVIRPR